MDMTLKGYKLYIFIVVSTSVKEYISLLSIWNISKYPFFIIMLSSSSTSIKPNSSLVEANTSLLVFSYFF